MGRTLDRGKKEGGRESDLRNGGRVPLCVGLEDTLGLGDVRGV